MILYFTSTGNCAYVAKKIAAAIGERALPIGDTDTVTLAEGEVLGFVFPTYFWALPHLVEQYMRHLQIEGGEGAYLFFVATYGTTCGATGKVMRRHLRRAGRELTAAYSVKMPDDWTPWFDLSDTERVAALNAAAEPLIDEIVAHVEARHRGNRMRDRMPSWMTFFSLKMYESYRKTKKFRVEDTCIGCGSCAAECPEKAIAMADGKPTWTKKQCTLCLHCVHGCPAFAIHYKGNGTKKHGQYNHKDYEK